MKAIGYTQSLPITDPAALIDVELLQPTATGQDLLVEVLSIAVNPVDCKIRKNVAPQPDIVKVLGWDAVGKVVATGELVNQFKAGDLVYYAGDLTRQGSNAQFQLVDQRIVALKPTSLSNSEAAALPLTAITAWELLFERLAIKKQQPQAIEKSTEIMLVVGAAGGVGSILVQLAKALTGVTVIGTASRAESAQWVKDLGADFVIDHSKPLPAQIEALGIGQVTHVASLTHTDSYLDSYIEVMAPMGKIALIDDPKSVDITKLKPKCLSLHWEFMFTRSMFQTDDMIKQSELLSEVAQLIDQGLIKTTLGKDLGTINAQNLRAAHQEIEAGSTIGKIVLSGF
ncbi:MAG: zinc-binding alcohol dehydrogenase family protein [Gammaproteobacteria bacterium]|nr:zinc-binding alcohol dehydrogenase family protein [Gammaproteobacteria bacterium]